MNAHNGPHGGMSISLQRVTSLRGRAQTIAPSASYWLRCVYNAYSSHLLAHLLVYSILVIKRMFLWYWLLNWLLRNISIIWLPTKRSQCTNLQKNLELLQPTKTFRSNNGLRTTIVTRMHRIDAAYCYTCRTFSVLSACLCWTHR